MMTKRGSKRVVVTQGALTATAIGQEGRVIQRGGAEVNKSRSRMLKNGFYCVSNSLQSFKQAPRKQAKA